MDSGLYLLWVMNVWIEVGFVFFWMNFWKFWGGFWGVWRIRDIEDV